MKYPIGTSLAYIYEYPGESAGIRLVAGYNEETGRYTLGPRYADGREVWPAHEFSESDINNSYRVLTVGGDEKATADTTQLQAEVERLKDQVSRLVAKEQTMLQDWDTTSDILNSAASDNGWCETYERILDDVNSSITSFQFPPRSRDYEVRFSYTVYVNVSVNAGDEDDAIHDARERISLPTYDRSGSVYLDWNEDEVDVEEA